MKVAVVTGASRGIGRACALRLARDGYITVVNYAHSEPEAAAVLDEIRAAGGDGMLCRADVSDPAQVAAMMRAVSKAYGQIDVLVNNAGILFTQCTVESLSAERINRVLATNVTGYFLCCREAVKRMSHRHGGKGGAIVNVLSFCNLSR